MSQNAATEVADPPTTIRDSRRGVTDIDIDHHARLSSWSTRRLRHPDVIRGISGGLNKPGDSSEYLGMTVVYNFEGMALESLVASAPQPSKAHRVD
jgi:hypothetical protein